MAKKNKQKKAIASGATQASSSDKSTKKALQPEPKIAKTSPVLKQIKGKTFQQLANLNEKKNEGKDQKGIVNSDEKNTEKVQKNLKSDEKNKEKVQKDIMNSGEKTKDGTQYEKNSFNRKGKERMENKNKEKLSGLICMCNSKTKPDCFRYMVMGFTEGRKELVTSIRPGMKLFLYDYELRLLYGIYAAASAGGMRLEPSAFNGGFSAQVRFVVERDCLPLPINVFKTAIKDNFEERKHTFKPELSMDQVKKLLNLFCSTTSQPNASSITSNPHPTGQPLHAAPIVHVPAILPPPQGGFGNGPLVPDTGRYHTIASAKGESVSSKNEDASRVLTVKDYKTYGLQPKGQAPSSAILPHTTAPQLPVSHSTVPPLDPYLGRPDPYRTQHYGPVISLLDPNAAAPKPSYGDDRYLDIHHRRELGYGGLVERSRMDPDRLQSTYDVATSALSDYNRRQQRPGGNSDLTSVPVSSRYSFAGPPLSYR